MMELNPCDGDFELICVIVNFGSGSRVLKQAKKNGIKGGTIFLGKGTIKNHLLEILDLNDIRKEIVIMTGCSHIVKEVLVKLDKEFQFKKPYHGIAFSMSVAGFLGAGNYIYNDKHKKKGDENIMYHSITVIVDKGKGELVMEAAEKAGTKGGTIINARGSGIHETSKLFSMEIEPEKEIVLILSEVHLTEKIVKSISKELEIERPGNGIIFIQDVNKTYGIYK